MKLYTDAGTDAALDAAISHALLQRAARRGVGSLRIWRPHRGALSLGRLDVRGPRAQALADIARSAGLEPVARLAGGRAAALDCGCLCVGWAEPAAGLQEPGDRYRFLAGAITAALVALGVAAELGESDGEWCPGAWSVRGPGGKLAGLAQRVIRGGAWCEALIVIERAPALQPLTERVHHVLGIPWRADAQGELRSLLAGVLDAPHTTLTPHPPHTPLTPDTHGALQAALVQQLRHRWPGLEVARLPEDVRDQALRLRAEHQVPHG